MALRIYMDWNASAPLRASARVAMVDALAIVGNPSSVHGEGRAAASLVERARREIAARVGAEPDGVTFVSGATEANATIMAAGWDMVFIAAIEHPSVIEPAKRSGARLEWLAVAADGRIDPADFNRRLATAAPLGRALLTIQAANGETGVVQDVAALGRAARARGITSHADATQVFGRASLNLDALQVDCLSLSAHKIGGPKGIGALVTRAGVNIQPLMVGGGQQRYRRGGTENVAAIAGFAAAARDAVARRDDWAAVRVLRDELEARLLAGIPDAVIVARNAPRLPNTSCVALPGHTAETMVMRLDLAGIAASAGAACSSGKVGRSAVLTAMGLAPEIARAAIRLSLGHTTTAAEIDRVVETVTRLCRRSSGASDRPHMDESMLPRQSAHPVTGADRGE